MIFCILTCGADRVDGCAAARREGSGRECVSRGRTAVAPARRYVGPRSDERALAAWFEFVGYRKSERFQGQAAQGPALLPPATRGAGLSAVRGWLWPRRAGGAFPQRFHSEAMWRLWPSGHRAAPRLRRKGSGQLAGHDYGLVLQWGCQTRWKYAKLLV